MTDSPLDPTRRADLARHVYDVVLHHTESLYADDHVGGDLAYLLGAIPNPSGHGMVDWREGGDGRTPALLEILREQFAPDHEVWHFVQQ